MTISHSWIGWLNSGGGVPVFKDTSTDVLQGFPFPYLTALFRIVDPAVGHTL